LILIAAQICPALATRLNPNAINEITLSFQVKQRQEEMKRAANNQEGLEEVLEDELSRLVLSHPMLLEMVEILELEYHRSNPQYEDEHVQHAARCRLLTARLVVFLSLHFMAGISLRKFTNMSRANIDDDDTQSIITFHLVHQTFGLGIRLPYSLPHRAPRGYILVCGCTACWN
jgi:hypothetical protein